MYGKMQICVCGWYYFPKFFDKLRLAVKQGYDAVVVRHQIGDTKGIRFVDRENTGLEWGAYSYFLENLWDGSSNVLFTQDDNEVNDDEFWNWCSGIKEDICCVFNNQSEAAYNSYAHGRMLFTSSKFLSAAKERGGFWYDKGNTGFIVQGHYTTKKPPKGCGHHNAGIHHFVQFVARIRREVPELRKRTIICNPNVKLGRRGVL